MQQTAHACSSLTQTLASGAAAGVRGLVSPGHQSNSAELHIALHDAKLHHTQLSVNLQVSPWGGVVVQKRVRAGKSLCSAWLASGRFWLWGTKTCGMMASKEHLINIPLVTGVPTKLDDTYATN